MFKRLVVQISAVAAVFALSLLAARPADAQAEVTVNGSAVDISPSPIIQGGRVFVPLRGVFEQLGASVVYSNGTINATGNGREISLQIGSTQATVNGQLQYIDVAPFIVGESTYVPLRFISEALGDSVSWDDANSIAAIDTGGGSATYYSPGTASYVDTAPPALPVYDQPDVTQPNEIWQPGYWAWGSYGYYWVPGTWVPAPQPNYVWTPGYWQSNNYGYNWNPGYWAPAVGFYGGVDYGGGYSGRGYDGGRWSHNVFQYNTYVTRVNTTTIRNVYIDRRVYVNNSTTRISFNGGRGGVLAQPTAQQLAVARGRHVGMTDVQRAHLQAAEQDRRLLASVNDKKPPVLAVARPLSQANRPTGFVPVKASDRVNPLANVAPVRVPSARATRPVVRAAAPPPARPVGHLPAASVAPSAVRMPLVHAPQATPHAAVVKAPVAAPPHQPAPTVPVATVRAPVTHAVRPAPVAHAVRPAPVVHAVGPAPVVQVVHPAPVAHFVHPAPVVQAVHPAPVEAVPHARAPAVYAAPRAPIPAAHLAPAPVRAGHAPAPAHVAPPVRPASPVHEAPSAQRPPSRGRSS